MSTCAMTLRDMPPIVDRLSVTSAATGAGEELVAQAKRPEVRAQPGARPHLLTDVVGVEGPRLEPGPPDSLEQVGAVDPNVIGLAEAAQPLLGGRLGVIHGRLEPVVERRQEHGLAAGGRDAG